MIEYKKMVFYLFLRIVYSFSGYLDLICYYLFLDIVIMKKQKDFLFLLVGLYLCCYFIETFLCVIEKRVYNKIFPGIVMRAKDKLMKKYIRLDLKQIKEYSSSDLKSRINEDTENLAQYYVKKIEILVLIVNTLVVLTALYYFNIYLAIFCSIMLPISFVITKHISYRSNDAYMNLRDVQIQSDNFSYFSIQNWKEIRLNGIKNKVGEEYNMFCDKIGSLYVKTHIYWFLNRTFIAFKDAFVTKISLYFIGGILIIRGYSEVSILLVFMQFYERLINTMIGIGDLRVNMGKEKESASKIQNTLDVEEYDKINPVNNTIHTIEMREGKFRYENNLIVDNISLMIERRKIIGIVGKSGCGKSTILKLMTGINTLNDGEVLIDSVPVDKINLDYIYNKIGIIMQDSYLFNLSIRENLLFGKETATEEEIAQACKRANILDYILGLDDKFDTIIGENGVRLSGGQHQRLVIARMLLHDPEIIFFDEATSALDSENETEIVKGIISQMAEKTFVIVSHDIDIIRKCNYIYFIENGRVKDEGSHNEIMSRDAKYEKMWGSTI